MFFDQHMQPRLRTFNNSFRQHMRLLIADIAYPVRTWLYQQHLRLLFFPALFQLLLQSSRKIMSESFCLNRYSSLSDYLYHCEQYQKFGRPCLESRKLMCFKHTRTEDVVPKRWSAFDCILKLPIVEYNQTLSAQEREVIFTFCGSSYERAWGSRWKSV